TWASNRVTADVAPATQRRVCEGFLVEIADVDLLGATQSGQPPVHAGDGLAAVLRSGLARRKGVTPGTDNGEWSAAPKRDDAGRLPVAEYAPYERIGARHLGQIVYRRCVHNVGSVKIRKPTVEVWTAGILSAETPAHRC